MISSIGSSFATAVHSLRNLPAVDPTTTSAAVSEPEHNQEPEHGAKAPGELGEKERREVEALRKRDREVKAHEQAHLAAAGGYARGGPHYTYKVGPDGKRYAVGGEVPIDVSEVPGDPMATLQKAMTVRRAALAPNNPSAADRAIAAKAAAMATKARQEMARSNKDGETEASPESPSSAPAAEPASQSPTLKGMERSGEAVSGDRMKRFAREFDSSEHALPLVDISI